MNFDHPEAVPVREAATTVLLRDTPAGLETLLLRRHSNHVFGADAYVFPGGAVDPTDDDAALVARCAAGVATARAQLGAQAPSYWMTAIRECFEEANLLVGARTAAPAEPDALDGARAALNAQRSDWIREAERLDLVFDLQALTYFAHWITPTGAPKRYSTRFFVAAAPSDGTADCDGLETTHAWWVRPAAALAARDRGEIKLMTPTRCTLRALDDYADVAGAIAGLRQAAGDNPAPRP